VAFFFFSRLQVSRRLVVKDLDEPKESQYETENKQILRFTVFEQLFSSSCRRKDFT